MTMRLSPSLVDAFAYYRDTDFDDADREAASLADLLAQIRGERREPTEAMLRGRAWHAAVQGGESDGFRFDLEGLAEVRGNRLPGVAAEVSGVLHLPEIDAVMHLRTDGLVGNEIHEDKTTSRIDADRYVRTCQWRAYLLAFGCVAVVYHIVRLGRPRGSDAWEVKDYLPFRQYRYPEMRRDLVQSVAECKSFIEHQGLAAYREES